MCSRAPRYDSVVATNSRTAAGPPATGRDRVTGEAVDAEGGRADSPGRVAYVRISDEIHDGTLRPGAPLVETILAKRLGMSRTPVRDALNRLEQDGLVERYDRGLRVRRRSPEEILEIYEIRVVLEAMAARGAAERRTALDLVRLEQAQRRMGELADDDPVERVQLNRAFHRALWRAGHNTTLADMLARLSSHIYRYSSTTLQQEGRWDEANREHEALIEAIRDRDPDRAAEIAAAHLSTARDLRL
ncbi:MAG: FCD domain-containing protein, partial [Streptosporangiales bacterium]|nr:FCD domain-containing protein [Streptosporangiales bacterium]